MPSHAIVRCGKDGDREILRFAQNDTQLGLLAGDPAFERL
jgi:hypothetical protein